MVRLPGKAENARPNWAAVAAESSSITDSQQAEGIETLWAPVKNPCKTKAERRCFCVQDPHEARDGLTITLAPI